MLGAITGDIVGSVYEHANIKTKDFPLFSEGCRFTDDTVCTIAIADCLMNDGDFAEYLGRYALRHPGRGYRRQLPTERHPFLNISVGSLWTKYSSCPDTGGSWEPLKVASWSKRSGPWTVICA